MKRKQVDNNDIDIDIDSDSGSDTSVVNVDFDFFDPNPNVDYHAINKLLCQLLQRDAEIFNIHELTELILSQPFIGTTVKTDGIESDPFALLTVLNMHVHHQHPSIKAIANYFLEKATADQSFHATLHNLFSQNQQHVGLVVCERLINMPVQVMPPMYRMLAEELKSAVNENKPYNFSHLLFISRTYHLTRDEESALMNSAPRNRNASKPKSSKKSRPTESQPMSEPPVDGIYSFHPEDETIRTYALHTLDFKYTNSPQEPREKDSFGLDYRARMMLVPIERVEQLVAEMDKVYTVI